MISMIKLVFVLLLLWCPITIEADAVTSVSSLFIIGIQDYPLTEEWKQFLRTYPVGGVVFVSKHYKSAERVKQSIATIKEITKHHPLSLSTGSTIVQNSLTVFRSTGIGARE